MEDEKQESIGVYWCNTHQREATGTDKFGNKCCAPGLSGILMPCSVVFIEDVEIEK